MFVLSEVSDVGELWAGEIPLAIRHLNDFI